MQELQQSPLFRRTQSRNVYDALLRAPRQTLEDHPMVANVGNGHVSVYDANTPFSLSTLGVIRAGLNAVDPGSINVPTIKTPTRANTGAQMANRLVATQTFALGAGARLWLTDQQTGCTVLVLDFGVVGYAMVHLLPHLTNTFSALSQKLMKVGAIYNVAKNLALRNDASAVVTATGHAPVRYILDQSQWAVSRQRILQLVGVQRNGGWEFYRQTLSPAHGGLSVIRVDPAPWRPWNEAFYHDI